MVKIDDDLKNIRHLWSSARLRTPCLGVERVRALVGFEAPQLERAIGGHGRDAFGSAGGRRVPHARIDGRAVALELDQVAGLGEGEGNGA